MVSRENQRPAEQSYDQRPLPTVDALQQGPRKKPLVAYFDLTWSFRWLSPCSRATDPLVHHGRHFGRTIHALCNVHALIEQGIGRMLRLSENPDEIFTLQLVFGIFLIFRHVCSINISGSGENMKSFSLCLGLFLVLRNAWWRVPMRRSIRWQAWWDLILLRHSVPCHLLLWFTISVAKGCF